MTAARRLRSDVLIGLAASLVAVIGIASSLLTRNEETALRSRFSAAEQYGLLGVAGVVLALCVLKAVLFLRSKRTQL